MACVKLTNKFVDSLPLSKGGQRLYWDTTLPGFGLCVGMKSKSYIVQRDIHGRAVRYTIGKHGIYKTDNARKQAQELLLQMSKGINPREAKAKAKNRGITLDELYRQYSKNAQHRLSSGTLVGYRDFVENQFSDWRPKPVSGISKDQIIKRHAKITEESGKAAANNALQFLRALFNFAAIDNEELANPVVILSQKKLWHKIERRRSIIKDHQLKPWYDAVMNLQNQTFKDALRFLLFTGLRKNEAFTLPWENVDLNDKTFLVAQTKNKIPLELPLSDFLVDLLETRKKNAGDSPWVFPGNGKAGYIIEPKKVMKQVSDESGVPFMLHDLRRTYITIAESLDISSYAVKQLVNHKSGSDVTAGYIIMDTERLREPMQKITDHIVSVIGQI